MNLRYRVLGLILSVGFAAGLPAGDKVWDGGGRTENWSEAANWLPNGVPKVGDQVIFDASSGKNCTIDQDASCAGVLFNETYTGTVSGGKAVITIALGDFDDRKGKFDADRSTVRFTGAKDQTLHYGFNDKFHCLENAKSGGKLIFSWHTITIELFRALPGTVTEFGVNRTLVVDFDLQGKPDQLIELRSTDPGKVAPLRFSGNQKIRYVRFRNIDAESNGYGPKAIDATDHCLDDGGNLKVEFGKQAIERTEPLTAADLEPVPAVGGDAAGPKKLRQAQEDFAASVHRLQSQRDEQVRKLTKRYVEELETGKTYYTRKGELENALAVKREIDNLKPLLEVPEAPAVPLPPPAPAEPPDTAPVKRLIDKELQARSKELGFELQSHPKDAKKYGPHWYKVIGTTNNWNTADAECRRLGGYLVCVTLRGENDFVQKLAGGDRTGRVWLGATDGEEEGVWVWRSRERLRYENWNTTEPNGAKSQNFMALRLDNGTWVDLQNDVYDALIVCEWEF